MDYICKLLGLNEEKTVKIIGTKNNTVIKAGRSYQMYIENQHYVSKTIECTNLSDNFTEVIVLAKVTNEIDFVEIKKYKLSANQTLKLDKSELNIEFNQIKIYTTLQDIKVSKLYLTYDNNKNKYKDVDDMTTKLKECTDNFKQTFHDLENDKNNITNCQKILCLMREKGFAVGNSIKDLDEQSREFNEYIEEYKEEYLFLSNKICLLYTQMKKDADRLQPLNDIIIE